MRRLQIFRLAAAVAASSALGQHGKAKRAVWALLSAIKGAEKVELEAAATVYALRSMPSAYHAAELGLTDEDLENWYEEEHSKYLRRTAWRRALERERKGLRSAAYRQGLALAAAANRESGGAL